MNEQHEIMSDYQDDINAEIAAEAVGVDGYEPDDCEASEAAAIATEELEALGLAPEREPMTSDNLDEWYDA
jgi:hypothetical protein